MNDIKKAIGTIKEIINCEDSIEVAFPALTNALKLSLEALEEKLNRGWIPVSDGKYIIEVKEGEVVSCQNFEI